MSHQMTWCHIWSGCNQKLSREWGHDSKLIKNRAKYKLTYHLCTNYLLIESIPIIHHPICKPISAQLF